MAEKKDFVKPDKNASKVVTRPSGGEKKCRPWEKPVLEDVSGKVMAQPYIRFT